MASLVKDASVLYVVAVCALIIKEDKVLAMRRSQKKDAGAGLWEALSGRVDLGEEPLDTVKREILEECGLEVTVQAEPVTAYSATRLDKPMIVIVYKAHYLSGAVSMSDEHDDYAWLTASEFAKRSSLTKLVDIVNTVMT